MNIVTLAFQHYPAQTIFIGVIAAVCLIVFVALAYDAVFSRKHQYEIWKETAKAKQQERKIDKSAMIDTSTTDLEVKLIRAGVGLAPEQYVLALIVLIVVVVVTLNMTIGNPIIDIAGALAAYFIIQSILDKRTYKRTIKFESQLCQAEMQIAENLRAGVSVERSIKIASARTEDPLRSQFERMYNEVSYSNIPLPEALENMAYRTASQDVMLLASIVKAQQETGSDLAESIDFLAQTILRRAELRNNVNTALSEPRSTINIVRVMPIVALVITCAFYDGYFDYYFHSTQGMIVLGVVCFVCVLASLLLGRMSDVKFEE